VNTVQFKILNRKCSFSIQLHPIPTESNSIQLNPIKSKKKLSLFKIRIRIEKNFNFNSFSFTGRSSGHELSLSLEMWKGLYEQQWNIYKMLRNEYKDNFINVGPLTARVYTLNATSRFFIRTTMTETTLRYIPFNFDGCIDVTFERLARLVVHMIDVMSSICDSLISRLRT